MKDSRIDEILDYIENANIDLEYDPLQRGPKFLNGMVAKTRNLHNTVQKFEREVATTQMFYQRKLTNLETEYEVRANDMLANDEDVKRLPSAKDREAKVADVLKDLRLEIVDLKKKVTDMGFIESVVKSKIRELKDVNRDLRLQIQLVKDELQIGNDWGDQSGSSNNIDPADVDLEGLFPEASKKTTEPSDYDDVFGGSDNNTSDEYVNALENIETEIDDSVDVDDLLSGY